MVWSRQVFSDNGTALTLAVPYDDDARPYRGITLDCAGAGTLTVHGALSGALIATTAIPGVQTFVSDARVILRHSGPGTATIHVSSRPTS